MTVIQLTPLDLTFSALLILLLAGLTHRRRLGITRPLLVNAVRMCVQLLIIGVVLKVVFSLSNLTYILLIAALMLLVASREVAARQKRPLKGWWSYSIGLSAMSLSSFSVTLFALLAIVGPAPWYSPQYAIPLLGMVLGNTMNGITISIDRLLQTAWDQRAVIEQRLMLGEECGDALLDISRDCLRSGMIPVINSMATAGIVSLPGMMTGQILAGTPPTEAVKYQILIWFLIAAASGFGIIIAISLTGRRLFDERQRLRLDRLVNAD